MNTKLVRPSIKESLSAHASALQSWFETDKQTIEGLQIRKLAAWLEPQTFTAATKQDDFDRARFELMLSNEREIWAITLDMIFYTQSFMTEEGFICEAGVKFEVLNKQNKLIPIALLDASPILQTEGVSPKQFCRHWFRRFSKCTNFSQVFAHKYFVKAID